MTAARAHHTAIVVRDVGASLRFWRDGIGFDIVMDSHFDGEWPELFGVKSRRLRSIFLGDPARPDSGIVELVSFPADSDDAQLSAGPGAIGFFLISCYVDVGAALARLAALGLGGEPRRITMPTPSGAGVPMATVVDPNGVLVELIQPIVQ
jgi:glyoxylase I family protein